MSVSDDYRDRIRHHLRRLDEGHDPQGHLFAIERLARIARQERFTGVKDTDGRVWWVGTPPR